MKILFTCLGNICRSPVAEAILKTKIAALKLDWEVASNGTNRYHKGEQADKRTIAVCKKNGIDISNHIATRFKSSDFAKYDLIICMANDVFVELQEFVTEPANLSNVIVKSFNDPWYGGIEGFEESFEEIGSYCESLMAELIHRR